MQAAIRPLHLPPSPTLDENQLVSKHYGSLQGHSTYDKLLTSKKPKGGWKKAAYVQILRDRTQLCTAVMLFAELERQESMAQRIIIYPEEWHLERGNQGGFSSPIKTSLRLLENAASRYKVLLQPVGKIQKFLEGMSGFRSSTVYQAQNNSGHRRSSLSAFRATIALDLQSSDISQTFWFNYRFSRPRLVVYASNGISNPGHLREPK